MATAGSVNRTLLQSFYQNAGDVYDDTKTEGAFGALADQIDANYDYTSGLVAGGVLQPYPAFLSRQALINGNFDVWQRGSSFSSTGYGADRWYFSLTNATVSKQTSGAPSGSTTFARITMNAASSVANVYQVFESDVVQKFIGKTVTFSIKLRRNASFGSNLFIGIQRGTAADSMGGTWTDIGSTLVSNASIPTGTTSSSWVSASVTVTVPNDGTVVGLRVQIIMQTVQATGAYFEMSQGLFNAGDQALPFQPRSFAEELLLCQRYYEKSYSYGTAPATATVSQGMEVKVLPSATISSNQVYGKTSFKVKKRVTPTITIYPYTNPSNTARISDTNGNDYAASSGSQLQVGDDGFNVYNASGGTITSTTNSIMYHWAADSEL